jgi:hypothetical protein
VSFFNTGAGTTEKDSQGLRKSKRLSGLKPSPIYEYPHRSQLTKSPRKARSSSTHSETDRSLTADASFLQKMLTETTDKADR